MAMRNIINTYMKFSDAHWHRMRRGSLPDQTKNKYIVYIVFQLLGLGKISKGIFGVQWGSLREGGRHSLCGREEEEG